MRATERKGKVQCPNKNVALRCKHIALCSTTHTPSIRCYKGWGRTNKRMSHVNSIWNKYRCWIVNAQCWIKKVEYWILKYGCWIVNDNKTRMLDCDATQIEYTNECRMWISVNSILIKYGCWIAHVRSPWAPAHVRYINRRTYKGGRGGEERKVDATPIMFFWVFS